MSYTTGPKVVIVGAGVVGGAAAHYLTLAGAKVTVVDKDPIGIHASGLALGGLGPLSGAGIPNPIGTLSIESWQLHLDLSKSLTDEYDFKLEKSLNIIFDNQQLETIRSLLDWQKSQDGFKVEWLDKSDVLDIEPRIVSAFLGAVVTEPTGIIDTYKFNNALISEAQRNGADLVVGEVSNIQSTGSACNVSIDGGKTLICDKVIVAMGPWSHQASEWLGFNIPITPLKGQILRLKAEGPPIPHISWSGADIYGSYAVTKSDGLVWVGTTEEHGGFDDRPSSIGRQTIMRSVVSILPQLAQGEIIKHTACLRPLSPDGLPVLGFLPGNPKIVIASGAGRKGILLGPVMGKSAADLVLNGYTSSNISALSPDRF
ncbi:MAG: glycine oxidase [Chloroflexi bacterium]|jgi:glycine oxidase|nr:MAG: glycine oxidase [Chloroflexota bacterium]